MSGNCRAALTTLAAATGFTESFLVTIVMEKGMIALLREARALLGPQDDLQGPGESLRDAVSTIVAGGRWTDQHPIGD